MKNPADWRPRLATRSEPRKGDPSGPATKPDSAAQGQMTVAGRVLDPDGMPVKGAAVDLVGRPHKPRVGASTEDESFTLLGNGATDEVGRFRLEVARTSSTRFLDVIALGIAPGFGLGWTKLNPDAEQPESDVRLRPEQLVRARLVDVSGMPAKGVEVHVQMIGRDNSKGAWDGVSLWPIPPHGLLLCPQCDWLKSTLPG
jgi:hypothetical protein